MDKLNIAELLKDCPSGTKLYSTIHGEVELVDIYHNLIRCKSSYGIYFVSFHSDGRWVEHIGECVIFPSKENRDWSTFQRPFKDGDIIVSKQGDVAIYKQIHKSFKEPHIDFYCGLIHLDKLFVIKNDKY